jgi:hypothetical protein
MLKIDAISVADMLEGYPDLFVCALVGDSFLSSTDEMDDKTEMRTWSYPFMPFPEGGRRQVGGDSPAQKGVPDFGSSDCGSFPPMRNFNCERHHDFEAAGTVYAASQESQYGSSVHAPGFGTFSIIPNVLWLFLPLWLGYSLPLLTEEEQSAGVMQQRQTGLTTDLDHLPPGCYCIIFGCMERSLC